MIAPRPLWTAALLAAALLPAAAAAVPPADQCPPGETEVLHCAVKETGKVASLCKKGNQLGWRYGLPARTDYIFPAAQLPAAKAFGYARQMFPGGGSHRVLFDDGEAAFELVFSYDAEQGSASLSRTTHAANPKQAVSKDLACGDFRADWDVLLDLDMGSDAPPGQKAILLRTGPPAPQQQQAAAPKAVASKPQPPSAAPEPVRPPTPPAPPFCPGKAACAEVPEFAATVTDVRASAQDPMKIVAVTVRFTSKSDREQVLGYVQASALVTDDQGNRYLPWGPMPVRGIGTLGAGGFEPKLVLPARGTADARFELAFNARQRQALGTRYELDLAIREVEILPNRQFRAAEEAALHFSDLADGHRPAAPAAVASLPAPAAAPEPEAAPRPAPPPANACGSTPHCFDAGLFAMTVQQVAPLAPPQGYPNRKTLRVKVAFTNATAEPLVLGYRTASALLLDDLGNRYACDPYQPARCVVGMGTVTDAAADGQFALAPGQTRPATFEVILDTAPSTDLGTVFEFDAAIEQLRILPSRQVRTERQHAVSVPGLRTGGTLAQAAPAPGKPPAADPAADLKKAAQGLKDLFKKKK